MQVKCPVILTCPLGVVIIADDLIWGHVRQTVLLQGKVSVGWFGRFRGRLLLTNRSFRFLACLKAFSDGFLRILLVMMSSCRILKFLEMILQGSRFMGWKVVTNGTLSFAVLFPALLSKISALDLVDARCLPLLIRLFG